MRGTQHGEANLRAVARAAGVGESTASRVLRNHGSFSSKTRDAVLEAARKLGYVPNHIARALASTESQLIGIVIPSLENIVFPEVLRGANSVLEDLGFRSLIGVTEYDPTREERLVESLLSWRPAGLLVTGTEHTERTRAMLREAEIRIAEMMDADDDGVDIVVGFSNHQAGHQSARHLMSRGYRRFGYVGHDINRDVRAMRRRHSFAGALAEQGLSFVDEEMVDTLSSVQAGKQALERLLDRHEKIEIVYFSNDDMAVGGYFHCLSRGIAIPDELALFGFNGLDIALSIPRPLSTIQTPRLAVGQVAAQLVRSNEPPGVRDIGFSLIEGSTA